MASQEGSGGKSPSSDRKKPRPVYLTIGCRRGWVGGPPTYPPSPPTRTLESKEKKTSTLEFKETVQIFKISRVKNVNKSKNRLTPVKVEGEKHDKKVFASREGSDEKAPSSDKKKPRLAYLTLGGRRGVRGAPTYPPTHTCTLESKEAKTSTVECKKNGQIFKISHVKNVNKKQNRLALVKLESKNQDKKVLASRESSGGKSPSSDRKKPRPSYII